ncbi:hypothetical protein GY45DRAFT_511398 [Cubamyces sp. BRFM 1775]|nr:hypothetical protein GY45DRAFT_511398 [Cubamyces sp. BRFM 1775]
MRFMRSASNGPGSGWTLRRSDAQSNSRALLLVPSLSFANHHHRFLLFSSRAVSPPPCFLAYWERPTHAMEASPGLDIDSVHQHPTTPAAAAMSFLPSASSSSMQNGHSADPSSSAAGSSQPALSQQKSSSGACVLGPRALAPSLLQRLNNVLVDISVPASPSFVQR